ncbi:MAG: hypothetical protein ACFFCT_14010 [Candidatus Odinarchaeota archaeon]
MSKAKMLDIQAEEANALLSLQKIARDIDSSNLGIMYDAVGRLAAAPVSRLLLPKAMDLVTAKDRNVKQAAFTIAGKNAFGSYLTEFFVALIEMNPAEREQVLQGIQEMFGQTGGPTSSQEQKNWIKNLEGLGREHQPVIFGLMIGLGSIGKKWIIKQIRDNIKGISLGAVPTLSMFPESDRKMIIGLLTKQAARYRRDLIPYICGIIDQSTQNHLQNFLRKSTWQERVEIAGAVATSGIRSTSSLVMELVADTNWQVKQALLENLKIEESKMSALFTVISHLLAESHTRVRAQAERTLLLIGTKACGDTVLKEQRKKLEKRFRSQLLKAAQANKDIDVTWLGIEQKQPDPMVEIMQMISSDTDTNDIIETPDSTPEGVSLADFTREKSPASDAQINEEEKSVLLSALLGAKKIAIEEQPVTKKDSESVLLDPTLPATSRFILVMQRVAKDVGKDVPLSTLLANCIEIGFSEEEFNKALNELEKQGIVYRSKKDTVCYVDIEQ